MPQELGARLPLHQLVFRPWRWNRWVWIGLLILSPAIYFLSAIPVVFAVEAFVTPEWDDTAVAVLEYAYFPVWWIAELVPALGRLLVWESDLVEDFLIRFYTEPAESDLRTFVLPFRHMPHQADLADAVWVESPAA